MTGWVKRFWAFWKPEPLPPWATRSIRNPMGDRAFPARRHEYPKKEKQDG